MLTVTKYLSLADERLDDAYKAAETETLTADQRKAVEQQLQGIRDYAWAIAEKLHIQL